MNVNTNFDDSGNEDMDMENNSPEITSEHTQNGSNTSVQGGDEENVEQEETIKYENAEGK